MSTSSPRGRHRVVGALALGSIAALGLGACRPEAPTELTPGTELSRHVSGRRPLRLTVPFTQGELVGIAVEQDGVDVVVTLHGPGGDLLFEVDSPTGDQGTENVLALVTATGLHRLEAVALDPASAGTVRVRCTLRRPATTDDRRRAAARAAWARAELRRLEGKTAAAEAAYRAALAPLADVGADDLLAYSHWRLGELLLAQGELTAAAVALENAARRFRCLDDPLGEARALSDLGSAHLDLGELELAERHFTRALALYRAAGHAVGVGTSLSYLGLAAVARADFDTALDRFTRAMEIWRTMDRPTSEGRTLQSLGSLYVRLGRFAEGIDHLERASRRLPADQRDRFGVLLELGWSRLVSGDPAGALVDLTAAVEAARGLSDPARLAGAEDRRGTALRALGRLDEAEAAYGRALALIRATGHRRGEAPVLANLGWLDLDRDRPTVARRRFSAAAEGYVEVGDPVGELHARVGLGRALRDLGHLERARLELERAVDLAELLRDEVAGDLTRSHFHGHRRDTFDELAALHVELHRRTPGAGHAARALEIADRARSRALLETLGHRAARTSRPARERLLETVRRVDERRRRLATEAPDDPRLPFLEERLRALGLELERLEGGPRDSPAALGADEIQALTDRETLLVLYQLGERESFAWTVDPGSIEVHVLGPGRRLEETAVWVADAVRGSGVAGGQLQAELALDTLARRVLTPIASRLEGRRRLALVLDGALHLVPFAALPSPDPTAARAPLAVRHEIVHLPSAGVLARQRRDLRDRMTPPGVVAVLADPVYGANDPRLPRSRGRAAVAGVESRFAFSARPLPRLAATQDEAAAAVAGVPPHLRLRAMGTEANRELALSGRLADFRVVHFAVHGLLHPIHPSLSALALSAQAGDGEPHDSLLYAYEIEEQHLPADLVVLSACETALGRHVRGEGLLGLARAFLRAGSRSVLATLWRVDDRATADLVERFYAAHRGAGLPPAAALRRAQIDQMSDPAWRAPAHWAGLTLHGDWRVPPNPRAPDRVKSAESPTNRRRPAAGGRGEENEP